MGLGIGGGGAAKLTYVTSWQKIWNPFPTWATGNKQRDTNLGKAVPIKCHEPPGPAFVCVYMFAFLHYSREDVNKPSPTPEREPTED